MMFVCCHPGLPPEAQSALALKALCGFSPAEIAKAFLISEAAVSKRLVRARQRIRDERIPFEIPAGNELPPRLGGVLRILYLLFNEGHKASHGGAITLLEPPELRERLGNYHLLHAVLGELELKRRNPGAAADHFRRAIDLTENLPERALLAERLGKCGTHESR